jgi:hypothetical protein
MNQLVEIIRAALAKYRLTFADEKQLQDQLAKIFLAEGLHFNREVSISPKDRLDFLIQEIAIEVKVGGSEESHLRQMKRYNDHPMVAGTLLISTRKYNLPETLSGKPVAGISIGGNRL